VPGLLITVEGIDGSGKTTQLERLAAYCQSRGLEVLLTREPGGTPLGVQLRTVLLAGEPGSVDPLAELLLYAADRAQHVRQVILPALEAGKMVLCDRYTDASLAYQGYGRGFALPLVQQLNQLATGGLLPDRTLLYDLEVAEGLRRTRHRGFAREADGLDRLDREAVEFHQRVRQGYLAVAAEAPDRVRLLSAMGTVDAVFVRTREAVVDLLPE
jgi:dTMP kinase